MGIESYRVPALMGIPGPGEIIADKYRVDKVLASGGMGKVLAATHIQLEQRVAIKVLLPEVADQPEYVERFLREARVVVGLRGEHAVRVFDVGTLSSGLPYMVMEYLRGHDLSRELVTRGRLPVAEAVQYLLEACEAVAEAHQLGIVHRDIKPANLFLAQLPDASRRVKVLDFGISKRVDSQLNGGTGKGLTLATALLGSPQYMSPEQLRNAKSVDLRSDIWSLGVVLYEMLADTMPFGGETLTAVSVTIAADQPTPLSTFGLDLPEGLQAVVGRCLEKDPARRYPSVAALVEALAPFAPRVGASSLERVRNLDRGMMLGADSESAPESSARGDVETVDARALARDCTPTQRSAPAPPHPVRVEARTPIESSPRESSEGRWRAPSTLAATSAPLRAATARRNRRYQLIGLVGLVLAGIVLAFGRGNADEPGVNTADSAASEVAAPLRKPPHELAPARRAEPAHRAPSVLVPSSAAPEPTGPVASVDPPPRAAKAPVKGRPAPNGIAAVRAVSAAPLPAPAAASAPAAPSLRPQPRAAEAAPHDPLDDRK